MFGLQLLKFTSWSHGFIDPGPVVSDSIMLTGLSGSGRQKSVIEGPRLTVTYSFLPASLQLLKF